MGFLINFLTTIGSLAAGVGSQACFMIIMDEPECPKSLIK